jgi:Na+/pantothenate symporter
LHHILLDAGYSATSIAVGGFALSLSLGLGAAFLLKLGVYRPLLVLLFFLLIGVHYKVTADRERAVRFFRRLPFAAPDGATTRV